MRKLLLFTGLLFFIPACFIAASYTKGIMPHLLIILSIIITLRVINGKEKVSIPVQTEIG